MKRNVLTQQTVIETDLEGNSSSEDDGDYTDTIHPSKKSHATRTRSSSSHDSRRSRHPYPTYLHRLFRFLSTNRVLVLQSFAAALAFVGFTLLIIYWPYLNSYWLVPQWRRVEAGFRSFHGDVEHLRRQHEMMAKMTFNKRRLLRSPHACEALTSSSSSSTPTDASSPTHHTTQKRAWLTAVANNNYILPTLALSHTLDQFSCVKTKIALVPDDLQVVSQTTRDLLQEAGFEVRPMPTLDCMSAHGSGASEIALYPGEYMRLYAWNMTEYDKIVYVDCDIMLLDHIDDLFDMPLKDNQVGAAYYEEPGIVDTGENSGLLVIKPREEEFIDLVAEWQALFPSAGCVADQPYLWLFYHQPGRSINFLPYSFNVRKRVYHPMQVWHFAGPARLGYKPWIYPHTPAESYDRPVVVFSDVVALWWHFLYGAIQSYSLEQHPWWVAEHERLMSTRLAVEDLRKFPPLRDEIK